MKRRSFLTAAGLVDQFFRETAAVGPQNIAATSLRYGVKVVGPPISAKA